MQAVLLLDAGNSALKWALGSDEGLGPVQVLPYQQHLAGAAPALEALAPLRAQFGQALGCCVAQPAVAQGIEQWLGHKVQWLPAEREFVAEGWTLRNTYRDPAQLGADRWFALLGARSFYPHEAWVLVQAGTATTIDGVSAGGDFVGGDILPGWEMMGQSLTRGAARLHWRDAVPSDFADNTASAMASGIADAQLGAIERFWRRFVARYAPQGGARVLLTGGAAGRLLAVGCVAGPLDLQMHDNLVLQGLCLLAQRGLGS